MLVYGLTLNQDAFELWLVELVNCKNNKGLVPGILFFFFLRK